jgi:hypothetical protein
MRPRIILSLALLALFGVLGFGLWQKWPSAQNTQVRFAPAGLAKAAAPSSPAPAAAPVVPQGRATATPAAVKNPQADLSTAIRDIVRLVRAGDNASFMEAYFAPNYLDAAELKQIQANQDANRSNPAYRQDPFEIQFQELLSQAYADLEQQKPELNSTGDEATYQWRRPATMEIAPGEQNVWVRETTPSPLTFIKINGKWYFKARPPLF